MIKVYCDRCGKKLNTDDPHYYPLGDAANGDDIFFTVSAHKKFVRIPFNTGKQKVKTVDDATADIRYEYTAPDLCPECMRAINDAVKTVWDGKKPRTLGEIYGMVDDENKNS